LVRKLSKQITNAQKLSAKHVEVGSATHSISVKEQWNRLDSGVKVCLQTYARIDVHTEIVKKHMSSTFLMQIQTGLVGVSQKSIRRSADL